MHAFISQFSAAVSDKEYKKAKKYLDENLFLSIHPVSELFEEAWEEVLKEIRSQLAIGNKTDVLELAEPFISDNAHKQEFDFLYLKQKDFAMFSILVENKKYFDAYGMLERAPYLNKTENYRKLEGYFTKALNESKKLIAESPVLNMTRVQELLTPFSQIPSKKEIVHTLLKNGEVFVQADACIKAKNFKGYFELANENPVLTEDEMYFKLCTVAENAIKKIRRLLEQKEFDNAVEGIRQLAGFLPYKPELSKLVLEIQIRKKLLTFIESNDIGSVYDLIAINPDLRAMKEFVEYEKVFDKCLANAMIAIGQGEIKLTQTILAAYSEISIFKPKVRECVRQATWNKLNQQLNDKRIQEAKTTASYYLKEFGKDHDFERLLKKHGLAK